MANQQHLKISGMLTQHEFKECYITFLLVRITHDVTDYEQLTKIIKKQYRYGIHHKTGLAWPILNGILIVNPISYP